MNYGTGHEFVSHAAGNMPPHMHDCRLPTGFLRPRTTTVRSLTAAAR